MTIKYEPCGKCENGYFYEGNTTKKCDCLAKYQVKAKLNLMLERSNIPVLLSSDSNAVSILDYDIDRDYIGEDKNGNLVKIKKFISRFDEKYHSLNMYWYSVNGCQKSTLAKVICKELLKRGKSAYYILADDLIKRLIDAERDDELKAECKKLLSVDFLVIDEMDASKITTYKSGYQVAFITTFLKKRIETFRKSVLFCSNREIDNVGDFFGDALQDLLLREVLDPMTFEDKYMAKRHDFNVNDLWS